MKQKLKKFLFLIATFLVVLSCSKDVYDEDAQFSDPKRMLVKKIGFAELKSNNQVFAKYADFEEAKERRKNSRIIEDTIYNYTIDTEKGIYIEKGDYNSYTFATQKADSQPTDKIENIVFMLNSKGEYDTYIVRYDFTAEELKTRVLLI